MPMLLPVYGVDVSKAELVIARPTHKKVEAVANTPAAIRRWLGKLSGRCLIGVESTGTLQLALAEAAWAAGHAVYVIDPRCLKAYRRAIKLRAKTDRCDAQLIAQYLASEHERLHCWKPPDAVLGSLQRLLRRRARIVQCRVKLLATLKECPELRTASRPAIQGLRTLVRAIDKQCEDLLAQQPRRQLQHQRLSTIPGIGPLSATGLLVQLERTAYHSSDAVVAGLGLDPRPDDSGQRHGERHLSKRGPSELRRLLYTAALAARRWDPHFAALYAGYLARGLSSITALVMIARKLVRIAYALYRSGKEFDPGHTRIPCRGT
jgi:transposase